MSAGTLVELKSAMKTVLDENDRISGLFKIEDNGGVVVGEDQAKEYRSNLAKAQEIKSLIEDLESQDALKAFGEQSSESKAMRANAAEAQHEEATQYRTLVKSLGEMFTDSAEFKAMIANGAHIMPSAFHLENTDLGREIGFKDVYNASSTYPAAIGLGGAQFDPMVPRAMRQARVRDLFPVARTNSNLIEFFRVIGFGSSRLDLTSSASVVPDRSAGAFGLKPHSSLTFESASAPVRTIAHYELAHRNVLADEPQLQSTINNELLYGLRLTEDNQILNGTGTGEDLLGILNTPNIQTYVGSSGPGTDNNADVIRRAATKAILAYYDPTGIVIHPYDWEGIELAKGSDGHYSIAMNVTVGAEARLWRMNVVDTPAIAQHTALVGAFGLGAQLYDRMEANIRIAEQHSDLFVRNAVAILAEERLALATKRPESFVKATLV